MQPDVGGRPECGPTQKVGALRCDSSLALTTDLLRESPSVRIVILGINFAPDATGIGPCTADLAAWLAARGHEVEVVTAFPYYPQWKKAEGDRGWYRDEFVDGIRTHRCWLYVPRVVTGRSRVLHEASFAASALLRLFRVKRWDVLVTVMPPLALGAAARIASAVRRRPYVVHIQDLQPDAALALGMVKPGRLLGILRWFERFAYRRAARVSGITPRMAELVQERGVAAGNALVFPNVVRAAPVVEDRDAVAFRDRLGVLPGSILASYSGNLGAKQGLDIIFRAAAFLEERGLDGIDFVIAGSGAEAEALRAQAEGLRSVRLLPLLPDDEYAALLAASDVCLVTQKSGTGDMFFPSKLLRIASAGRPVVAVCDPESVLDLEVKAAGLGWTVEPGDAEGLAVSLAALRGRQEDMSAAGRAALSWSERFSPHAVYPAYEAELFRARDGR